MAFSSNKQLGAALYYSFNYALSITTSQNKWLHLLGDPHSFRAAHTSIGLFSSYRLVIRNELVSMHSSAELTAGGSIAGTV